LNAIRLAPLQQVLELLPILVLSCQYHTSIELVPKSKFSIELREHLISLPAIFGPVGTGCIVVSGMNNTRIALSSTLTDIVGRFQPQDGQLVAGQFSGNGSTNTPRSNNNHVIDSIGVSISGIG
jgi:hypothetical protein